MKRLAQWIQWHRRAGLLVAPVVLMLVITGILINHSQSLGWHSEPVYSPWLGRLYGIPAERVQQGFAVAPQQWLLQSGDELWLNSQALQHCEQLVAAERWPMGYAVLCDDSLLLLTTAGELIERISDLPGRQRLGLMADQLVVGSADQAWRLDDASFDWQPLPAADVRWAQAVALPAAERQRINAALPLPGVSAERVLLDLHSGRLFGDWGVWLVDAAAILMLFLAFSGSLTWAWRALRKRNR